MTRNQLNRLYWIKIEIEKIEVQIKELTVLKAVQYTGMPKGSGVSSPVEQFTEKLFALQDKLNRKLNEYVEERTIIESFIENIDEPEIRVIARMRYIDNEKWEAIGKELHMDRSTASKKLTRYEDNNL